MPRGSKPGERRGGRKRGTPNKATREIREAAREYGEDAVEVLAGLMMNAKNEQTRLAAANSLLDRGFGKVGNYEPATKDGAVVVVEISKEDAKL